MSLVRQALFGVGLLAALAGYYLYTQHRIDAARTAAQRATTHSHQLSAALKAARADVRIVTQYVDRVHTVHERGRTITKEVPVYVPSPAVARCTVNRGFVRLYNAAAQGTALPAAAVSADAPARGVGLDTVARTSVHNLTTSRATAEQLKALQDWVRAHQAPQPP